MEKKVIKKGDKTKIIIALIIILILAIILFAHQIIPKKCQDLVCFEERAEKCLPTIIEVIEDDTIITSRITSECKIVSTFENINEQGKRELDHKKTCFYEKNKYMETIIETDVFPCITE